MSDPKALISTGKAVPVFSKSKALPPDFVILSAISVISRTGSQKGLMRMSSFFFSRADINSARPEYAIVKNMMKSKDIQ
jgi:hypothetical protein